MERYKQDFFAYFGGKQVYKATGAYLSKSEGRDQAKQIYGQLAKTNSYGYLVVCVVSKYPTECYDGKTFGAQPPPPEPKCPPGQVMKDGKCQPVLPSSPGPKCPPGQVLKNGKCVPVLPFVPPVRPKPSNLEPLVAKLPPKIPQVRGVVDGSMAAMFPFLMRHERAAVQWVEGSDVGVSRRPSQQCPPGYQFSSRWHVCVPVSKADTSLHGLGAAMRQIPGGSLVQPSLPPPSKSVTVLDDHVGGLYVIYVGTNHHAWSGKAKSLRVVINEGRMFAFVCDVSESTPQSPCVVLDSYPLPPGEITIWRAVNASSSPRVIYKGLGPLPKGGMTYGLGLTPVDVAMAKGALVCWSLGVGKDATPLTDYGAADVIKLGWNPRDKYMLQAWTNWWNKSYTPKLSSGDTLDDARFAVLSQQATKFSGGTLCFTGPCSPGQWRNPLNDQCEPVPLPGGGQTSPGQPTGCPPGQQLVDGKCVTVLVLPPGTPGAPAPAPGGKVRVPGGAVVPGGGTTTPAAPKSETPWGWIIGGVALAGIAGLAIWAGARGVGGAMGSGARANPLPTKNMSWRSIKPEDRVTLEGHPGAQYYVVTKPNGTRAVAIWGGQDAREAQRRLDQRARVTGLRKGGYDNPKGSRRVGTIGDANPVDYGGGVIYRNEYGTRVEYTHGLDNDVDTPERMEVYSVDVPDDVFGYHNWVKVEEIAQTIGADPADLLAAGRSKKLTDRVYALEAIAAHWGWQSMDQYPMHMTEKELRRRWRSY